MSEPVTPARRAVLNLRRLLSILVSRVRRVFGILLQVAERDQLRVLTHETRRLSSASVESVTHLGSEVRSLDERLAKIEDELAALRALLEERSGSRAGGTPGEVEAERSRAR